MKALVLMVAMMVPASAIADTCITMDGPTVINRCRSCVELTVRALRPETERSEGPMADQDRLVQLDAGARETLEGGDRWAIIHFRSCH
jgi:hypothetical protein